MSFDYSAIPRQEGRTFIVTDNIGIGKAAVAKLASLGATVVLACRSQEKGRAAADEIRGAQPGADIHVLVLDLASLDSIRRFADAMARFDRLDALIHNAGVMLPPPGKTADGFEIQFGTNFLGPYALTGHLLPMLDATPNARVVSTSSVAHWTGRIDFARLNELKDWPAYAQSKLANILFAFELDRRLRKAGSSTRSIGVHPGGARSNLGQHNLFASLAMWAGQSASDAARPAVRAALDPAVQGGEFYGPGRFFTIRGAPNRQIPSRRSRDPVVAARLWDEAGNLTGIRYLT